MEEEKAAAYYDELTRKGEGAARFKQGLGFSSSDSNNTISRGSASFLSNFVKASSPTILPSNSEYQPKDHISKVEKQSQLHSIQNKLKKKPSSSESDRSRVSEKGDRNRSRDRNYRDQDRDIDRHSRRRSRSRDRYRDRDGDRDRDRRRRSSRSVSPCRERRSEKRRDELDRKRGRKGNGKESNGGAIDYARLIDGYEKMLPAERIKAKMKFQLAETAEKDAKEGMGHGWERFEFNKDAPLDDEEIEVAEDDAALVKHIGQSFRFSTVEAKREDQIKAAHDEAIFGAPAFPVSATATDDEPEVENKEGNENGTNNSLLSEKVLAKQQGSWRDRARKI